MKIKHMLSGLLSLGLVVSLMQTGVKANELSEPVYAWGNITEINENQIRVQNDSDLNNDMILNMNETTVIMDAVTGNPVLKSELKIGDSVSAYISPVSTKSLPPIINAYVIVTNIPADYATPKYYKVAEILESEDGTLRVIDTTGSMILTFDSKTEMSAFKTKNIVGFDDIKVGTEIMAWYSVVALSLPGKTVLHKAMILPEKLSGWVKAENEWMYYVDGVAKTNTWVASSEGRWYYVGEDGLMVRNVTVDGCQIDGNGVYKK